jgi:hypothetical protein
MAAVPIRASNLVHGVGVGKDVVRRLPIGMFVGIAEARHPECRGISEGSAKIRRNGAGKHRLFEGVNNSAEQVSGERLMVGPTRHAAASREQVRQFLG